MTRIAGISPASTIGTGACIAIGTLVDTLVGTTSCTGIDITAGTMASITALMPDVTTTGTAARTMIGMVAITMTRGTVRKREHRFHRTIAPIKGEACPNRTNEKDKRCARLRRRP